MLSHYRRFVGYIGFFAAVFFLIPSTSLSTPAHPLPKVENNVMEQPVRQSVRQLVKQSVRQPLKQSVKQSVEQSAEKAAGNNIPILPDDLETLNIRNTTQQVLSSSIPLDKALTPYVEPDPWTILPLLAERSSLPYRDLEEIVYLYFYYAREADLNAYVLLAQAIHETGWFTSWWSQPPRRNVAGLGVSGAKQCTPPPTSYGYVRITQHGTTCWLRGYTYATWDEAVRSHVAWVLYYVVDEPVTEAQRALLATIGKERGVGRATVITDLNGVWAVPGTTYGQRISRIANLFLP